MKAATFICLAAFSLAFSAQALPRDALQIKHFRQANPCPATGLTKGPCKGWQVDHFQALMLGGEDHPRNMQWSTTQEHRAKTRQDFADCKAGPVCLHRRLKRQ